MKPAQLSATAFSRYAPAARDFAVEQLRLLQRLPLVLCPSFLVQIQSFSTLFPAERDLLQWQCSCLSQLPPEDFARLTTSFASITTSQILQDMDWVNSPANFVTELTSYLWSSNQLDRFRRTTADLFAAIPGREDAQHRLVIVVLGQGAKVDRTQLLRKLRPQGVLLTSLDVASAFDGIAALVQSHQMRSAAPYTGWYVDGGEPRSAIAASLGEHGVVVSYPGLSPIRQRVLNCVQATLATGTSGPEQMRTRLMETSPREAGAQEATQDPVLQRFFTELFTQSSGPQIFSTSFVQWTGRELARRAQPRTLLLRYAPRQRHQDMNTMFAETSPVPDPEGSLRDAEMGAYYNWIEMRRISGPGRLTFIAWVENQPFAVILGAGAPAGAASSTSMTIQEAVNNFG